MTNLGKVLVFINVAISFFGFTLALLLFTNRIDFSNRKAQGDTPAGELAALEVRVKKAGESWRDSQVELAARRDVLAKAEQGTPLPPLKEGQKANPFARRRDGRYADRDWYEAELALIRTGQVEPLREPAANPNVPGEEHAKQVAEARRTQKRLPGQEPGLVQYTPGGQLILDPQNFNRPRMTRQDKDRAGDPLRTFLAYDSDVLWCLGDTPELKDDLDKRTAAVKALEDALRNYRLAYLVHRANPTDPDKEKAAEAAKKVIAEKLAVLQGWKGTVLQLQGELLVLTEDDTRLTNLIVGIEEPRVLKGFQQLIKEEKAKAEEVLQEREILEPALINAAVDSELLIKRQASLKARVAELKAEMKK